MAVLIIKPSIVMLVFDITALRDKKSRQIAIHFFSIRGIWRTSQERNRRDNADSSGPMPGAGCGVSTPDCDQDMGIRAMAETGRDMHEKCRETSLGGLLAWRNADFSQRVISRRRMKRSGRAGPAIW